MQINGSGLDLIKTFEGLALDAYRDVVGVWTIGYGHTGPDVREGMNISESQAERLLKNDVARFEQAVSRLIRVPISPNQFSALVSLAYNIGEGALGGSTVLQRLNRGDLIGAADAIEWWNKGRINGKLTQLPGLVRRRAAERALFLKPETPLPPQLEETTVFENTRILPSTEASNRREGLGESRTVQGAGAAAVAGTGAAVGAAVEKAAPEPETLSPPLQRLFGIIDGIPEWAYWVMAGVVLLATLYIVWARVDDWRHHRR